MAIDTGGAIVRVVNVAKFDVPTIEAIEADRSLTREAGAVVVIIAVISSLGLLFSGSIAGYFATIITTLIGWGLWSWLAAFIARTVFQSTTTDTGEMLRVCGYALAPRLLGVFDFISPAIGTIGVIWSLSALVIAIRQAGELTTGTAILTTILAAVPWFIAMAFVLSVFG